MRTETLNIVLSVGIAVGFAVCWWAYHYLGPRLQPHYRYFKRRHKEHEAGWRVLFDGECIAELDYLRDDQPFHLFRFIPRTDDQRKIEYALRSTAMRDPDSRILFQNRAIGIRVPDGEFLASLNESSMVSIRDFRTPVIGKNNERHA